MTKKSTYESDRDTISVKEEPFLSRWSARKRGETVDADSLSNEVPSPEKSGAALEEDASGAISDLAEDEVLDDSELLEKYALPNPASMQDGDDFSAFMQKAVPDRLRRLALRRLWQVRPDLGVMDGLVDYGEDFRDLAVGAGVVETAYDVKSGYRDLLSKPSEDNGAAVEPEDVESDGKSEKVGKVNPECSATQAPPVLDNQESSTAEQARPEKDHDVLTQETEKDASFRPARMKFISNED